MSNKTSYNFIKVNCDENSYAECWIAYYIWRSVPFILIVMGTCGNILNILVLSRKRMRNYSTSVYLLFLAGSDIAVLWTGTALDAYESIKGNIITDVSSFTCRSARLATMASAGFSAWILVLLTLERFLISRSYQFASPNVTPQFAAMTSVLTLVVILTFTSHLIFGFHLVEIDPTTGTNSSRYNRVFKCTFTSNEYRMFYYDIWRPLILIFLNIIPVIFIICGNITIGVPILLQRKKLQRIFPDTVTARRTRKGKSPTKTLFLISGTFLLTTLPYTIFLVLKSGLKDLDEHTFARYQLITVLLLMLIYSNFTFNFLLYFVSGTLFKQEWEKLKIEVWQMFRRVLQRTRHQTAIINLQQIA